MLTVDQIITDTRKMTKFICERIPTDAKTKIVLADGGDGPLWAELYPTWDGSDCDLFIETNEPDAVGLRDIYKYFRCQEMTCAEREREVRTPPFTPGLLGSINKFDSPAKTNKSETLTVKEAAAELNCSISFVYKLMYIGELVYEKRGRRRLPTTASIADYRHRNIVLTSQRFDYPKKNRNEPYEFQQLFKKRMNQNS